MKRWPFVALPIVLVLGYGVAISSCAAGGETHSSTSGTTAGAAGATSTSTSPTTSTTPTTSTGGSGGATTGSTTGGSGGATGSTGTGAMGGGGTGGMTDFLTPCQDDSECQSGVCIQIADGTKACTIDCSVTMTCPSSDFRCAPLNSAQDVTRYCLPRFNDLCKPCNSDQDCWLQHNGSPVFDRAECEEYSSGMGANETVAGSFCTTECTDSTLPCPNGYSCKGIVGSVVKHCFKDDMKCDCLSWWPDPSTTCSNTTVDGTCSGTRSCMNGTLSSCSATVPAPETCNGMDDNCNGTTDEGGSALCANGGLACVTASCGGAAGCQTTVNAGFCVIGGSLCVVAGTKNPADQCQSCDPTKSTTGWSIATGQPCDDGEPCTTGETCNAAGMCQGGAATNCSAFGTPPCSTGVCQMGMGCVTMNNNGVACDDGKYCTVGETCSGGLCGVGTGAGTARDCSALTVAPCKTGVCNEATDMCVAQINTGTTCNDNNPCSTASSCDATGTCVATSFKDCSGQNDECNVGVCNTANGNCQKQAANIGASCFVDVCQTNGACTNSGGLGVCSGGTPIGDSFEANNTVGTARAVANIDDCGNATPSLNATINGGTDDDWYRFTLNNSSVACDYGTIVSMTPPPGRDYDLQVCVFMSGGFSASCATGTSFAAPAGLTNYRCCQSTFGTGVTENVKIDWTCSGTFCSDPNGTVYMRVFPKGGSQTAECTTGYTLSWHDD